MLYFSRIEISEGIDLVKQVHQKNVIFVTIGIFQIKFLSFSQMSAKDAMIY